MKKKLNKPRLFRNSILVILILGCLGFYFSNRFVKSKGFQGLGDFIDTYQTNKELAADVDPTVIQLQISEKDYKFLKKKRQEALNRGIQINIGDNYVDCQVIHKGDSLEGEMRLKGHMTDHLEGDKWSFRVKTEKEVMGMYRFSLQNPATRNYAYEWVYHQLLKRENIMHLKYDFVRLKLNEKDLGIYAVEEHFGQHVPRDNQRPPGAVLRWNPELYWEWRIDEMDSLYLDEEYSAYSSSFPEAYDRGVIEDDPQLIENYRTGAAMLEAFRRGDRPASEVFDVKKMAGFHAIIDLVGGYHSLDWSDVKFFYNQTTQKIEPVGYESFSVRESTSIAGQRRPSDYASIGQNYHDQLFADTVFFATYISELERICDESYLREFQELVRPKLNLKRGVLAAEFAYIKFTWDGYYKNIANIRHNLALPKPFHAFLESSTDSTVTLALAPVSDFPIEILSLEIDDEKGFLPSSKVMLPAKPTNTFVEYQSLEFQQDDQKIKDLFVLARIPGSENTFRVAVSDLPSYMNAQWPTPDTLKSSPNRQVRWVNDSTAFLDGDAVEIDTEMIIPKGKKLILTQGQKIHFNQNGAIYVNGAIECYGTAEYPIRFTSSASNPVIFLTEARFSGNHCQVTGLKAPLIAAKHSNLSLEQCVFADIEAAFIQAKETWVTALNCSAGNMQTFGDFDRCLVRLRQLHAKNGHQLIIAKGSDIDMHTSTVSGYDIVANLNHGASFSTWTSRFAENKLIGELKNAAAFNAYICTIESGEYGFTQPPSGQLDGFASYTLYKTASDQLKSLDKKTQER